MDFGEDRIDELAVEEHLKNYKVFCACYVDGNGVSIESSLGCGDCVSRFGRHLRNVGVYDMYKIRKVLWADFMLACAQDGCIPLYTDN